MNADSSLQVHMSKRAAADDSGLAESRAFRLQHEKWKNQSNNKLRFGMFMLSIT